MIMQTESNHPSDIGLDVTDTNNKTELLIPRKRRRRFFLTFTLMTIIGWVVGGIASIAIEKAINEQLIPTSTPQVQQFWFMWGTYVSLTIFAVIFAADQAIAIRRYISGWWWLLATSFGWLASIKVSSAWISYITSFGASLNRELLPEETLILGIASTSAYILSGIWISFCQWVVLRRYTIDAWWWNLINSFAFLLISFLVWLLSLVQDFIPPVYQAQVLYLSEQGLTALVLGAIPAIGLCRLKTHPRPNLESK